jgi:hypothetical protein
MNVVGQDNVAFLSTDYTDYAEFIKAWMSSETQAVVIGAISVICG